MILKAVRRTSFRASKCLALVKEAEEKQALRFKRAAVSICRFFIAYRAYRRIQILNHGFTRLAAVIRSKGIRRTAVGPLQRIYCNLKACQDRLISTIGEQSQLAITTLQTVRLTSQVSDACRILTAATEASLECCLVFIKSNASQILFHTIRTCNRSSAHQELLTYALMVLLNVSRRGNLASQVAMTASAADVLVDLMQMFRDKPSVFGLSCELLCRLCASSKTVKDICNTTEYRKRLDGIAHIIERKHRLENRVASIGSMASSDCTQDLFMSTPKGKGSYLAGKNPFVGVRHLLFILHQ